MGAHETDIQITKKVAMWCATMCMAIVAYAASPSGLTGLKYVCILPSHRNACRSWLSQLN